GSFPGSSHSPPAIEDASETQEKSGDWEIDGRLLKIGEKIACGSCGDLYRGIYLGQDVAVKILRSEHLNDTLEDEFAQEVSILREVQHRNVVRFIGACTKSPQLSIVTEYMPGGSLYDYLHKNHNVLKLSQLLKFAIDVCKGMEYLHQNHIIHRDLKTANLLMDTDNFGMFSYIVYDDNFYNVLVTSKPLAFGVQMFLGTVDVAFGVACGIWDSLGYLTSPNIEYFIGGTEFGRLTEVICIGICTIVVKVADFGVARFLNQGGVMTAETGTYRWMAPEVINHQPYDQKADVFSFAVVLWELVTAKVPYDTMTPLQAALGVRQGLRPELPENAHPKLLDLMQRCWEAAPDKRPSFSEITTELETLFEEVKVYNLHN
ncbi:hypothetical protein Goshw_013692, partial [Gossypium schwendimanii]|nr:hypothetical protein [Gossypium schwendimanii]